MEIVLLGLLGTAGYYANRRKNTNPTSEKVTVTQLENEFRHDVAQHMNNPNVVIGGQTDISNNVPFFRSMKSQNTNNMVKDRRLETFTGVNNVDYAPKRERESDTPVKGLTNIYGTTFAPDMERYNGYVTNGVQNNVTPFEKQYVGPGLGVSVDTPSAGGFHQRFRILPDNVNGYRKNTFGGEIVVGKSHIDKGTSVSNDTRDLVKKLTASEMYAIGDRPLDAAYGHVHGPSVYSNAQASLSEQNNRGTAMDAGLLGAAGAMSATGTHVVQQSTRDSENLYATCVMGGQYRSGTGGYQNARYLVPNESDRENLNCHRLNVGGNSFGSIVTANASSGGTQRGEANTQQLGKQQPGMGFAARGGYNVNPTQKDFEANYHMGIAGSSIAQGSQVGVQNVARNNTLRGQAFNKDGSAGPAGSYVSAAQRYDRMFTDHEKTAVFDHTPNTQRTVNMMYGSNELRDTVTQQKNDWNDGRVMSNGQGVGTSNFTNRTQLGYVYASQDSDVNTRDFGYAPENELRTNILIQPTRKV
jgi:hypothetical protein